MTYATSSGIREAHVAVPRRTDLDTARLSFDNGLEGLHLVSGSDLDGILEGEFADPLPVVWTSEHNVHVEYPLGARLLRRPRANTVRLARDLTWAIDVHGGGAQLTADLTDLSLQSLSFHSGLAHAHLKLGPTPCVVRLGSVKDLRIERPDGVPVRLRLAKGAAKITLDDNHVGAVGNGLDLGTDGGYEVLVSGGADTITITEGAAV